MTKWHVRLAKTQISLGIRPVRSASSLCVQWVAKDPGVLHAFMRTAKILIRLGGCWAHSHFVGFIMRRLIFFSMPWTIDLTMRKSLLRNVFLTKAEDGLLLRFITSPNL